MQNLPLGIQEFSKLREDNLLYVDKTAQILKLISNGDYYFLSRPRRFGKSLLVNTLKELFLGNKKYFKDLFIEDKWDFVEYPVIKIDFSKIDYKQNSLLEGIKLNLLENAKKYQVNLVSTTPKTMLDELIAALSQKNKVVILIDEYDKPIIDFLDDLPQAEANRDILKNLYSPIKPADALLKFVFITGVSKFAKVSIFSDLNHLFDITIDDNYTSICGYTQEELEFYFQEHLAFTAKKMNKTSETLLPEIKKWYNGYSWNGRDFVYNPFSVLNFFAKNAFFNVWFSTGTPTFLTKLLKKGYHYDLKNTIAGFNSFDTSDLADLDYVAVLFQTGYLTIKRELEFQNMYELDFPNMEVQDSFTQYLLAEYASQQPGRMQPLVFQLYQALKKVDIEEFVSIFQTLFSAIPYNIFDAKREIYFQSVIFLTLKLLGFFVLCEVKNIKGRLDCVVFFDDKIFIFEFKLNQTAEIALAQIKEKGYATPYAKDGKEIYLIGINMDSTKKDEWEFLVENV